MDQSPASIQPPRALYQKVKDHILTQIASGQWPPDTRITSENQLVKDLGVSRMTVNRALRELVGEGHLVRVQGVGTFVARAKTLTPLFKLQSIDEEISEWGGVHQCEVVLLAAETAFPELARLMELPVGAPVFHSVLVHKDRGVPVLLADRYVNTTLFPEYLQQDFTRITPSDYLLQVARPTDIEHIIEATLPDRETRRLLKIDAQEPCLVLHRQTWVGSVVSTHSRLTYPGSRYRIGGRFRPLPSQSPLPGGNGQA